MGNGIVPKTVLAVAAKCIISAPRGPWTARREQLLAKRSSFIRTGFRCEKYSTRLAFRPLTPRARDGIGKLERKLRKTPNGDYILLYVYIYTRVRSFPGTFPSACTDTADTEISEWRGGAVEILGNVGGFSGIERTMGTKFFSPLLSSPRDTTDAPLSTKLVCIILPISFYYVLFVFETTCRCCSNSIK